MKMKGSLILAPDLTVGQLQEALASLPATAKVSGAVTLADRFGVDQYRLEITWETEQ
jgi:hypothetical protein